jgi:elongation factor 1 alpha-like protein
VKGFSKAFIGPPKAKTASKKAHGGEALSESVEKLSVQEPKVKSKNLNVVEEYAKSGKKRMANFVVIGKLGFRSPAICVY